jgi:hypothetical protein
MKVQGRDAGWVKQTAVLAGLPFAAIRFANFKALNRG